MNFLTKLRKSAQQDSSILCLGIEPVLERIPVQGKTDKVIVKFFSDILDAMAGQNTRPGMIKLSYACFAMYGFPGFRALKKLINVCHKQKFLVTLDAKFCEIGNASQAYAREAFDFWKADSVTVTGYLGKDSIEPFMAYCEKGKGVYLVNRTPNQGAADFQNIVSDDIPLYMRFSHRIVDWYTPGIGSVVGAWSQAELEQISSFFVHSKREVPLLIPEVDSRAGHAGEVAAVLKKTGNELAIHRMNSSWAIAYAYQKEKISDYAGAAVKALKRLNDEVNFEVQE
jgi:orotidine-5'-phosphate decarboxylase